MHTPNKLQSEIGQDIINILYCAKICKGKRPDFYIVLMVIKLN